jgi:hypothetical protein
MLFAAGNTVYIVFPVICFFCPIAKEKKYEKSRCVFMNISYINLIEPEGYPDFFLGHPPLGFTVYCGTDRLFCFKTNFYLLTTLENDVRAVVQKIPLFRYWSGWLNWSACFIGTTITEYAPLPPGISPSRLFDSLSGQLAGKQTLTVLKDLPIDSPLLNAQENEYSQRLAQEGIRRGFFELAGQALAYVPIDFSSLDDYLSRLSHGRRKDLRRKLKTAGSLSIDSLPTGDPFFSRDTVLDEFYAMYLEVFQQSQIRFDLLSRDFFKAILNDEKLNGLVITYRHNGALAGYNICLLHNGALIDKYIGFKYPLARQLNLYFISWLYNLELALKQGCAFYVAGWTDPEVKASLGAKFTFTRHLVWIKNPLLRRLLYPLRHLFESDRKALESL